MHKRTKDQRKTFVLFVALLVGVMLVNSTSAQQTVSSATLSGRVQDPTGGTVKGASVTVKNLETNFTCTCSCNDEGVFNFPSLAVGSYTVDVEAPGFALLQHQVTLSIGQRLDVLLKLNLKGLTETVNVPTDLPVLETARTQLAEPVLPREIDSLPLNGRNYLDLAALTPGVSRSEDSPALQFNIATSGGQQVNVAK